MVVEQILPTLGAAIGAVLGPFATAKISKWFSKEQRVEDDLRIRKGELIDRTQSFRDLACVYWNSSSSELGAEDDLVAAQLVGLQHELSILASELFPNSNDEKIASNTKLGNLLTSATGGSFGEPTRVREPSRLREIQVTEALFRTFVSRP